MSFYEKCYTLLKKVPRGKVTTYKALAVALNTKAYMVVGSAMKKNPMAPLVPCHRVINSDGHIGGYMGSKKDNTEKKIEMLTKEGVKVINGKIDLDKYMYEFR